MLHSDIFMKSFSRIFVVLIFLGFLAPTFVLAQSLSLPHQFFGSVNFTDGVAPDGLVVEARINDVVVGNSVTAGGNYGYNPNLLFALDNQGIYAGGIVEFYVDDIKANETADFVNGDSNLVNLTIPTSIPTTPTPTSGGGGGGVYVAPPTSSPLSDAAQKVDVNNDNKIDVLDFNTLMVNWGSASTDNIADFNGDGTVDVFDFNSLMINWTS
jgi:hypothetical protein